MTEDVHKKMSAEQIAAGRALWDFSGRYGRINSSVSADYERAAPKTWLRYVTPKMETIEIIECELYQVPRFSNPREVVLMMHGMCPKCHETFTVREDNKTLFLDGTTYSKAPMWLRELWEKDRKSKGSVAQDADKIPLVSSGDRWACDYCKGWCVKCEAGVVYDEHKGNLPTLMVPVGVPIIGASESAAPDVPVSKKVIL